MERNLLNKNSNIFESFESNHGSLDHALSGKISNRGSSGSGGAPLRGTKSSKSLTADADESV